MARPPQDDIDQVQAPRWLSPLFWTTYLLAFGLFLRACTL